MDDRIDSQNSWPPFDQELIEALPLGLREFVKIALYPFSGKQYPEFHFTKVLQEVKLSLSGKGGRRQTRGRSHGIKSEQYGRLLQYFDQVAKDDSISEWKRIIASDLKIILEHGKDLTVFRHFQSAGLGNPSTMIVSSSPIQKVYELFQLKEPEEALLYAQELELSCWKGRQHQLKDELFSQWQEAMQSNSEQLQRLACATASSVAEACNAYGNYQWAMRAVLFQYQIAWRKSAKRMSSDRLILIQDNVFKHTQSQNMFIARSLRQLGVTKKHFCGGTQSSFLISLPEFSKALRFINDNYTETYRNKHPDIAQEWCDCLQEMIRHIVSSIESAALQSAGEINAEFTKLMERAKLMIINSEIPLLEKTPSIYQTLLSTFEKSVNNLSDERHRLIYNDTFARAILYARFDTDYRLRQGQLTNDRLMRHVENQIKGLRQLQQNSSSTLTTIHQSWIEQLNIRYLMWQDFDQSSEQAQSYLDKIKNDPRFIGLIHAERNFYALQSMYNRMRQINSPYERFY